MKIVFIRHSKVLFKWEKLYNSTSFQLACREYDVSPVLAGKKLNIETKSVYVSSLVRTEATAKNLFHKDVKLIKTDLLNEVPLLPFTKLKFKLPTILWMLMGRLQWYFNISQPETRTDSKKRINKFLDLILAQGTDCVIIGHGFFFAQMLNELKERGIAGNGKKRLKNEEQRIFVSS